ncbi:MAG: phenylalanine--tRNA ligase subunit alpha [Chitinivibrionales bacterium]|nr:phenylalanine--tRNA ligase subunit alpha [Chitinivibrionales bacterium]MBD3358687.1 phenylalanine--tRNA ligase subunit alpha [Chitinivibrionales bacterium]
MGDQNYTSIEELEKLTAEVNLELEHISDDAQAEAFRIKYLGKKGLLRSLLKSLKDLPEDHRRTFGARANQLRAEVEERFKAAPWKTAGMEQRDRSFDPTLPGLPIPSGSIHPLSKMQQEICDIFVSMGFEIAEGPEAETEYYNFTALNFPPHHPARDMQDTFFISDAALLRTHTSPVQIRVMEKGEPPIRCIMPGRVYRNEEINARSYCLFGQIEGLYVDENVSMADLKGTLLGFARRFFDEDTAIKIRPSFFPFTEPSIEIDIKCFLCKGEGCSVCKHSGWLEVLGAGMVHPNVLAAGGVVGDKYTGFAFGLGIDRLALLKYGIDDIRLFYENDMRFLRQF